MGEESSGGWVLVWGANGWGGRDVLIDRERRDGAQLSVCVNRLVWDFAGQPVQRWGG